MTAIAGRRTKVTLAGFAGGVVALGAVAGLGYAGVDTLADSRAGRRVTPEESGLPVRELPYTHTALVGAADEDGWLTSVVVMVLEPDGTGGSIVSLSPSADEASGNASSLTPLNAVYAADGPQEFLSAAEGLTGLSFDVAEVVDAERFTELVTPLGELVVDLPTALRDASTEEEYAAGVVRMSPAEAAAALISRDPELDDWLLDPARAAVWEAVADAVDGGIGVGSLSAEVAAVRPASLDEFVSRLFAGPVDHRAFASTEIGATRVAEQLDDLYRDAFAAHDDTSVSVVAHGRAELMMVFGSIAPRRLGAPFEGYTVRVVSRFPGDQLEPLGVNNADVALEAINRLLFAKVNVVSFGQTDTPPEVTVIEVADPGNVPNVEATFGTLFGASEVRAAEQLIEGIDLQITLGTAYLETVESTE